MKDYSIYYFSGTGNTKTIARLFKAELECYDKSVSLYSIESDCRSQDVGNTIIFCYPIHGFNVPLNFLDFVKALPTVKNTEYYIVKTSGEPLSINSASSYDLIKLLTGKGYVFQKEFHIIMPYNIIFKHSDNMATKMLITAKSLVARYSKEIINGVFEKYSPSFKSKIVQKVFKIEHWGMKFNGKLYSVNKSKCISCSKCVNSCPTKNIVYENNNFYFGNNCLGCQRCAFLCPTNAINIGILNPIKVNGVYNFNANADEAILGKYCKKSYLKYFKHAGS